MKAPLYNQKGEKAGDVDLPEAVFDVPWNGDLVHQVLSVQRANQDRPIAHAKDRSERRGGGRKPWRQKGTGRARHGSIRSPIWQGGGVTHGPRNEKVLSRSVNTKMKRKALHALLSRKHRDGEVVFMDSLSLAEPRTREAKRVLTALGEGSGLSELTERRRNAAYVALGEYSEETARAFRNFGNIRLDEVRNMNLLDVARYKYIVIVSPTEAFRHFSAGAEAPSRSPQQEATASA